MTTILRETDGRVAVLTVNRPDKLNALNEQVRSELLAALAAIEADAAVGAVVITGAGDKSFIAGADIREIAGLNGKQALELSEYGHGLFRRIEDCPKPILAAINGFALGGGCELAMACHIRTAAANARLGLPEVNLGLIPGYGGTQRLARLVGQGKAMELILTGEMIDAEEAHRIGLVNQTAPSHTELMELSLKIMRKILSKGPVAVAKAIESVHTGNAGDDDGYKSEARNFAFCATTKDFEEGTSAFLEKRKPNFKGE